MMVSTRNIALVTGLRLNGFAMPSKPLNEILGEMMAEAGPMIFQAMQR